MNNHENISEELLARYLADTASEIEKEQVQTWLKTSAANQEEFEAYKILWQQAGVSQRKKTKVNTDAAWSKLKAQMNRPSVVVSPEIEKVKVFVEEDLKTKPLQRKLPVGLWAAAVVAMLVMTYGWFLLKSDQPSVEITQVTTAKNTTEKVLPDGTKVFLNHNSKLTYPKSFDGKTRNVTLSGEAFFDVKPDANSPFIINANGTEIKVLGTSFNVKAYHEEPVRVDVSTGKVSVRKENNQVFLTKGESAEILPDTIRSIIPDANILGYRTQIFDFNAADLEDVVSSIRSGYHINLRLSSDKIAQCRLTIRFDKEPVDATLSVIAETLDLKVRKEGETYWLDGNGCQ